MKIFTLEEIHSKISPFFSSLLNPRNLVLCACSTCLLITNGYAQRYEAENANLNGPVVANNQAGYSGAGFADYPSGTGHSITWTISIATPGVYTLEFGYALASGNRPLELRVDGSVVDASLDFPGTGAWTTYDKTTPVNYSFTAGNHTIRLRATSNDGGNLDYLDVTANTPAQAINDNIEVGVQGKVSFDPTENDTFNGPVDLSAITFSNGPTHGNVSYDPVLKKIVYLHTGNVAGNDSFQYTATDSLGESATGAVNVVISNAFRLANQTVSIPLDPPPSNNVLIIEDGLPGLTFQGAVAMDSVPGNPNALLVASINGKIWYVPDTTVSSPTKHEILDISSLSNFTRGRSIYSIRCFPDFASTGNIIINYQGDASRLPTPGSGQTIHDVIPNLDKDGSPNSTITTDLRVSRFTLSSAHIADAVANGVSSAENQAALSTELPYINMAEQDLFHSINDCHFDANGYLYISFGDEGSQGDPHRNGQRLTKDMFSSIIRLDVNPGSTNPKPNPHYSIAVGALNSGQITFYTNAATQEPNFRVPADNPFIHTSLGGSWNGDFNGTNYSSQLGSVRTEIWAFGLRNPFKFHLDIEPGTGEIEAWIGDVGKSSREEFTILKKGENGGWSYYEGDIVTPGLAYTPPQPSGSTPHKAPLYAYDQTVGNSAIGGIYYRDFELDSITNRYICGDHGTGRIWSVGRDGSVTELVDLRIGGNDLVDFHLDPATKDVFVLGHLTGRVRRITTGGLAPPVNGYPLTLSATGVFADLATLTPNPGVVPYVPNLTFWSDGAKKKRWFMMKSLSDKATYSQDSNWSFPEGMIWIKHFDFDLDHTNPGQQLQRLETRILVKNAAGSYGVSYRWNTAGTDAFLVNTQGENFDINFVNDQGNAQTLNWQVPSRADCFTCHSDDAGHALSFNTRQLNLTQPGHAGNFIDLLRSSSYLDGFVGSASNLPKHYQPGDTGVNLEARVRSYLDVNCAYCHQDGGGAPDSWDARASLTLAQTAMLYGMPVSESSPNETDHLIRPGSIINSAIWNRMNARTAVNGSFNGYSQMPPIASNLPDKEGIELLRQWIENHANAGPQADAGSPSSVTVPEDSVLGISLGSLLVTDPDVRNSVTDQSQLRFSIASGNPHSLFSVDPLTGNITVNGLLDFESLAQHNLQIAVTDNFNPNPKSTVIDFTVNLTDVAAEDVNGNDILDWWENGFGIAGSGPDSDQDTQADFFEFLGGSDPTDPASYSLVRTYLTFQTSFVRNFEWRYRNGMVLGRDYYAQISTDLVTWVDIQPSEYMINSNQADGLGFSKMSIQPTAAGSTYFLRLSSKSSLEP